MNSKSVKNIINILTLIIVWGIVFYMGRLCPYLSDDWHFMFVWEDFDPLVSNKRVENFNDIFISMQNYYLKSGGRVISHVCAYIALHPNKLIFDIINAVMFVVMCIFVFKIQALYNDTDCRCTFPLTCGMLIFLIPDFGDNILWLSGSINYLWPVVVLLGCLLWLMKRWESSSLKEFISIVPCFTISALTNEVTGGMIVVAMVMRLFISEKKQYRRFIILMLFVVVSSMTVLMAPGNIVRRDVIEGWSSPEFKDMLKALFIYIKYINEEYSVFNGICLISIFFQWFSRNSLKQFINNTFFAITGLCGIAALSATGNFVYRPIFTGMILMITYLFIAVRSVYIAFIDENKFSFYISLLKSLCGFIGFQMLISFAGLLIDGIIIESLVFIIVLFLAFVACLYAVILCVKSPQIDFRKKKQNDYVGKIKNNISIIITLSMTILSCVLIFHIYNYSKWSIEYRQHLNYIHELIIENKLESAGEMRFTIVENSGFIPKEAVNVNGYYLTEWMAEYYGVSSYEYVQSCVLAKRYRK